MELDATLPAPVLEQVYLIERDTGLLCRILGLYAARGIDVQRTDYAYAARDVMTLKVAAISPNADTVEALRVLVEKDAEGSACQIAQVHAARRETDAAFEWLERAYEQRDAGLATMKSSMEFRNLHGDPRWPALIRKMNLEDSE